MRLKVWFFEEKNVLLKFWGIRFSPSPGHSIYFFTRYYLDSRMHLQVGESITEYVLLDNGLQIGYW